MLIVKDHCHITGKYTYSAHSDCKLGYNAQYDQS